MEQAMETETDYKWQTLKDLLQRMMDGAQTGQMAGVPILDRTRAQKMLGVMLDIEDIAAERHLQQVARMLKDYGVSV